MTNKVSASLGFSLFFLLFLILPTRAWSAELTLLYPNGSEEWRPEINYKISWQANPMIANIGLALYKNKQRIGIIVKNIPANKGNIVWAPGFNISEGNDYRIGIYEHPFGPGKQVDFSNSSFAIKKGNETQAIQRYFTLDTKAESVPLSEILYFNSQKNSGWIYVAETKPEAGISFWAAAIRSFSNQPTDTSAQLLYGITNANTNQHFSGFIDNGSLTENANTINVIFAKDGLNLLEFRYLENKNGYELKTNLPALDNTQFQISKNLASIRPILLESGDGIIPMAPGLDSLYASLVFNEGFWIDFQKFNASGTFLRPANHRWMSFILDKSVGLLPAGSVGVGWEILDSNNERQPGGYTNIDLLIPNRPQLTAKEEEIDRVTITELEYWQGGKKYLKKWRIDYPGIELLFETLIPNQEHFVGGNHLYEGMIIVRNPNTGEQIGTGMFEQTHDESLDK